MANFGKCLTAAKEILPLQWRIGETRFTSIAAIRGKIYIDNTKNMNYVHKYSKDLVKNYNKYGENISWGDTVFYYRVKQKDLAKKGHALKIYMAE